MEGAAFSAGLRALRVFIVRGVGIPSVYLFGSSDLSSGFMVQVSVCISSLGHKASLSGFDYTRILAVLGVKEVFWLRGPTCRHGRLNSLP